LSIGAGGPEYRSGTGGPGVLLNNGALDNTGSITIAGSYGYYASNTAQGGQLQVLGTMTNAGYIGIAAATGSTGVGAGGTLAVAGAVLNTGTIVAAGAFGGFYEGSGGQIAVTGDFTNDGLVSLRGGVAYYGYQGLPGALNVSGLFDNAGMLVLTDEGSNYTGLLTVTGSLVNSGTITGVGLVTNQGQIAASGTAGVIGASIALTNDATISVGSGDAFTIGSTISADGGHGGVFDIAGNGLLTLDGGVAANQTVAFTSGAELALGDASGFDGVLDLQPVSTIDFLGLDLTAASLNGTTLQVTEAGGATLNYTLGAPLEGAQLVLNTDNHGGTDLLVVPGP
jgi:hypothetical protein